MIESSGSEMQSEEELAKKGPRFPGANKLTKLFSKVSSAPDIPSMTIQSPKKVTDISRVADGRRKPNLPITCKKTSRVLSNINMELNVDNIDLRDAPPITLSNGHSSPPLPICSTNSSKWTSQRSSSRLSTSSHSSYSSEDDVWLPRK